MKKTKEFGKLLKKHRKARGLTQEKVAERIGVKQSAISKYEKGRLIPRTDVGLQLTAFLQIPIPDLDMAFEISRAITVTNTDESGNFKSV